MKKKMTFLLSLVMMVAVLTGSVHVGAEAINEPLPALEGKTVDAVSAVSARIPLKEGGDQPAPVSGEDGTKQAVSVPYNYDELTVATTNPLSGRFFTDLWGGNTSDHDVRALLHGYSLTEYRAEEGTFAIDGSVVNAFASQNRGGNREYIISIYEDLYYSDGTKITAKDYVFSILFNLAPETRKIGGDTTGMYYIKGAKAYNTGKNDVLTGVKLLGEYQFSINVDQSFLPFFYELGYLNINPYPISVIAPGCEVADDGGGVYLKKAKGFTADVLKKTVLDEKRGYQSHPSVVSGPYKLVSYDGTQAEFEINEYYKGNSAGNKPRIKKIIFKTSGNETITEELRNAEIGLANKIVNANTVSDGVALVSDAPYNMTAYPRSGYSFISFCCEQPAVADTAVRQAIALCFDKKAFTADYTGDYGIVTDGYYGIGQWMYQLTNGFITPENVSEEELKALTLDTLKKYDTDIEAAKELLDKNGWTFTAKNKDVRTKKVNGKTLTLELKLYCPAETGVKPLLEKYLGENLKKAGIKLTVWEKSYSDLLKIYYRQATRNCDMIYLATNFEEVFDPAETFNPSDAYQGVANRTGITDDKLYQLARDMSRTAPDDMLGYVKKWIAFQERYTEVLPTIPVYSNTYYDFYTSALHDYEIASNITWTQAIVNAVMSDAAE